MRVVELNKRRIINRIPNTFIGGVASTIPDAQSLVDKVNRRVFPVTTDDYYLTISDIGYFGIVGNDIEVAINSDYIANFESDTNITYFKETAQGRAVSFNFRFASSFEEIESYKATHIEQLIFQNANLLKGNFYNAKSVNSNLIFGGTSAKLFLPKATLMTNDVQNKCFGGATSVYIPQLLNIGISQANNTHFNSASQGVKIWAHPSLETSNGGLEEGDLAYARANKAAVIDYSQPVLTPDDL